MTSHLALAQDRPMSDSHLIAEILDRMGTLLHDIGGIKERLNHGQSQFETIREENAEVRRLLEPVVDKVAAWEEHVIAAKETTREFNAIKPEFGKMKTVTARFMSVALVQGSVVGAALWGITLIWPVIWEWMKAHISLKM